MQTAKNSGSIYYDAQQWVPTDLRSTIAYFFWFVVFMAIEHVIFSPVAAIEQPLGKKLLVWAIITGALAIAIYMLKSMFYYRVSIREDGRFRRINHSSVISETSKVGFKHKLGGFAVKAAILALPLNSAICLYRVLTHT